MKKKTVLMLTVTGLVATQGLQAAGVFAGQQLMVNPFMETNKDGWSPTSPWRNNGAANQVYDHKTDGPTGFFSTTQDTVNISTTGDHFSDIDFDASTSKLTDIQFKGIFLGKAAAGNASGGSLSADLFIEFDITTAGGTYRAKSSTIADPWTQTNGVYLGSNTDYTWQGGGFLGDPFASGGLVLDDITGISVSYFMNVTTNNAGGAGTVFTTIDNASIQYEVTTYAPVPEPSSAALLGLGGLALTLRRRK